MKVKSLSVEDFVKIEGMWHKIRVVTVSSPVDTRIYCDGVNITNKPVIHIQLPERG